MNTRHQTSAEGALYEIVARGVKDTYFIKDDKESTNPFDWRYSRWPSSIPEIRYTEPLNQPRFGQRCEWEFDLPADVLVEATLVIELPSWLPPELLPNNGKTDTTDANGNTYGYVNGIAYFLFEKIEIYQDKILLQEVSGDSLYAARCTKSSWNQGFLTDTLAGIHNGSTLSIMRNATPGQLELPVPMMGCFLPGDRGLPLCGLRNQNFRLRVTLRKLEELVEAVDGVGVYLYNPKPWLQTFTQNTPATSITLPAVNRDSIGQPQIKLRTKQLYLPNDLRKEVAAERIEIPFIRYFDNIFSANALDYAPLAIVAGGGTAQIKRLLDADYTVERIVTYFRNSISFLTNQLWNFIPFSSSLELVIAGQSREGPWNDLIWTQLVADAKEERTPSQYVSIMNWSRGWRHEDETPGIREPTGGINFSTADRPTLNVTLTDIAVNLQLGYKQGYFTTSCESWAMYVIDKGRGRLEYAN
jgi:hypothetical protein